MTVKIKLIYLICMILCVLITLSTVSATDIDDELISDSNHVAKISQSESSITNLNENINEIGIYSEDKDCVDSMNGLSNLNSENDYSDLNSINSDEKSLKSSLSAIDSSSKSYENDLNDDSFDDANLNVDSNDGLKFSNGKNTLKSDNLGASESSFADLQKMISNAANGSTINLGGKTFVGNGSPIWITKPITIDGGSINNKATLNGNFISNITAVTSSNVHIINCNFINDGDYGLSINANNTSVKNCNFEHNNLHLYVGPTSQNFLLEGCNFSFGYRDNGTNAYVDAINSTVRNCNFFNNTIFGDTGKMGYGGALQIGTYSNVTNEGYVVNCSFINNTVITNNNETHAGALCFRPGIKVSNSTFINNYCNKVGGATTLHADGEIVNCIFINNSAGEYGGAITTGYEYDDISVNITNCTFINNSAPMGGAIQIKGHNVKVTNSKFEGNKANENEGGAVFIVGDYTLIINSTFENNFAKTVGAGVLINGSDASILNSIFDRNIADYGAAVYVIGTNANLFSSNITNHNVKNGSVYIKGIETYVYDSIFERNSGESGAGIYIEGSNATLISNGFTFNNASQKGGAIYIDGSNAQLILSSFLNNDAIPDAAEINKGLGGAIYIKGDNNLIDSSTFKYNTARNGSAIYTDGLHMTLSNTNFDRNQAWSYSLEPNVNPVISFFNESDILIDLTLIGGNNIANAIYNTVSMDQIYFYNVSYISSKGEKHTGEDEVHPVDGAQNSNDGSLLYQDDREDNQLVNVMIYRYSGDIGEISSLSYESLDNADDNIENNPVEIIFNQTFRTGILGDISFNLSDYIDEPLNPSKYLIHAKHYEDEYYKGIFGDNPFEILPLVDLIVEIGSSRVNIDFNKTVKYTIKVKNNGPNDASGVNLSAIIPEGLAYLSSSPSAGTYDSENGIWNIGNLALGENQTLIINVSTNKSGLIDFPVSVSSIEDDSNISNNINNKTIRVLMADLAIDIKASEDILNYGDIVDWTITLTNNGPNDAVKVLVSLDPLDENLIYLNCSNDDFNETDFKLDIPSLLAGDEISFVISTKANGSNCDIVLHANASADTFDEYESNNFGTDDVKILPLCDLITKVTVSDSTANYDDIVYWVIDVSNDGPDDASNVVVSLSDLESLGAIILDSEVDSFDKDNLEWFIGNLPSGEGDSLSIATKIKVSSNTIPFEANASSQTLELNYDNNHDDDSLSVNPLCDLIIDLAVSNSTANYGDIVDWLVVVTNDGPDNAFDVVVSLSDLMSAGLVVLDFDGDSFDKDQFEWFIGDLESGESTSLSVKTIVNKSNENLTVFADVKTSTFEANEENNHDDDRLAINPACDLAITIVTENNPVNVGDTVNWIINITNRGPDNAGDVNVYNSLPEGLEYIVSESSKGEIENIADDDGNIADVIWKVGDLDNNESAFLIISTQALEDGNVLNNANANSSTFDIDQSNNLDSTSLVVVPFEESDGDGDKDNQTNNDSDDSNGNSDDGGENQNNHDDNNGGNYDDNYSDDGYYDGYYDDYPWKDYNFLDDSNNNGNDNDSKNNPNGYSDLNDSLKNKSKASSIKKDPIDFASKKTGNPIVFAIISIFALFSIGFKRH